VAVAKAVASGVMLLAVILLGLVVVCPDADAAAVNVAWCSAFGDVQLGFSPAWGEKYVVACSRPGAVLDVQNISSTTTVTLTITDGFSNIEEQQQSFSDIPLVGQGCTYDGNAVPEKLVCDVPPGGYVIEQSVARYPSAVTVTLDTRSTVENQVAVALKDYLADEAPSAIDELDPHLHTETVAAFYGCTDLIASNVSSLIEEGDSSPNDFDSAVEDGLGAHDCFEAQGYLFAGDDGELASADDVADDLDHGSRWLDALLDYGRDIAATLH
jgi:hypothetical protein